MKPEFYNRIPMLYHIVLGIIFMVLTIGTLGLAFNAIYDFCWCHKYWRNRRILYKHLKTKDLSFTTRPLLITNQVIVYTFDSFTIWKYNKQLNIAVHTESDDDIIGTFVSSTSEDRMVIKLIRKLNSLVATEK